MKKLSLLALAAIMLAAFVASPALSGWFGGGGPETLTPKNSMLEIPIKDINDGKSHHFKVKADDGAMVTFFVLKSSDGVIRSAIDSCDVCFKSGKGYFQDGDFMVCQNCGQRFASNKINEIKGGCNPAPLERQISGDNLVISMADITKNSWYMRYRS